VEVLVLLRTEVDLLRTWPLAGILEDDEVVAELDELTEPVRRCLYCVNGGRERSCLMGSLVVVEVEASLGRRVEVDLCRPLPLPDCDASGVLRVEVDRCNPPVVVVRDTSLGVLVDVDLPNPPAVVVGLLVFARGGGGRIDALPEPLLLALGGRVVAVVVVLRVEGLTGSLLGD
jgi:hypothetical protein